MNCNIGQIEESQKQQQEKFQNNNQQCRDFNKKSKHKPPNYKIKKNITSYLMLVYL